MRIVRFLFALAFLAGAIGALGDVSARGSCTIFVKTLLGQVFEFRVHPGQSVRGFKEHVAAVSCVPV